MCTERAQERELERKRGGKGRKGEKERDKEKNLGAKKPKLALVTHRGAHTPCLARSRAHGRPVWLSLYFIAC